MQLPEQHAPVVEEVSRGHAAEEVSDVGLQPSVQPSVDVELPGIGWFLNLRHKEEAEGRFPDSSLLRRFECFIWLKH